MGNTEPNRIGVGGVLRQLLAWSRPHALASLAVLGLVSVQVAYYLAVPFAFKIIFDEVIPRGDLAGLGRVLAALGAGYLACCGARGEWFAMPRAVGTPQEPERAGRRTQRLRAVLPWVALFAAALLVRSLRFGLVFVNGEVRFPYGADELYHMRRIWFTVVNFPASLDFDLYMNHPEGAGTIWPPFFDWGIAALARVLVGPSDPHAVEVVAAWMPPLIGALAVVAAAWLARRTFSPASGWATGVLLAPLPAHVWHGSLGMVDHQLAVGLFTTLLLAAAMRLAGPLDPTGRPRGAVSAGVAVAAAILLWPGGVNSYVISAPPCAGPQSRNSNRPFPCMGVSSHNPKQ